MIENKAPQIHDAIMDMRFTTASLDDIESLKNAQMNRLRTMTTSDPDSDGNVRGFGMHLEDPLVIAVRNTVESLSAMEADFVKQVQKQMKANPLGGWVKAQRGVGEKQVARLLACIGDPFWRSEDIINTLDQPVTLRNGTEVGPGEVKYPAGERTLRQLWAYVGVHTNVNADGDVVAARRQKGVKANWNAEAKSRAWLIIASCMKQVDPECRVANDTSVWTHPEGCNCSPYRVIVDNRRQHTAVTHPDWTPGHSLNDAQRIASRELLRHLWLESKRIHEGGDYAKPKTRTLKAVA